MQDISVSESLNTMYEDYYENDPQTLAKRALTAIEVWQHIRQICDLTHVHRLLDVGAGEGSLLLQLSQAQFADELYGVEISESGLKAIQAKNIANLVEVQGFNGYKIPYPDKFFTVAIASHVLEHVEHERLFLSELKRVAEHVLIEVPLEHTYRIEQAIEVGKPYGHINFYTLETFSNLLTTSGLQVKNCQVVTLSGAFESFSYGKLRGTLKNMFRQTLLRISPRLAATLMVYFCIAYCVSEE
jgi:ubiquinone/menaquinone biosynthesis C-methylase UbiE